MTLHPDQPPLITPSELHVSLLPETHPQYTVRRLTVRRMTDGDYAVTRCTPTGCELVLAHNGDWHFAPERAYSTRNDDYRAWLADHRFTDLYHALAAASLVIGAICAPGDLSTTELLARDGVGAYPDRGRDTSCALTGVRAVLSRAESEWDALRIYERHAADPEAETMRDTLAFVTFLLGRWRRTGRPAKTAKAAR